MNRSGPPNTLTLGSDQYFQLIWLFKMYSTYTDYRQLHLLTSGWCGGNLAFIKSCITEIFENNLVIGLLFIGCFAFPGNNHESVFGFCLCPIPPQLLIAFWKCRWKIEDWIDWHSLNILFLPTFQKFRFSEIEIWTLLSKVTVWKLKLLEMLSGYSELLDNNLISKPGVF